MRATVVILIIVVSACQGAPVLPTSPPAMTSDATIGATVDPSPATSPAPTATVTSRASVGQGDGDVDPDGRIAFGRITRIDDEYGQVVALFAIDPDGSDLIQLTDGESAFPAWSPDGSRLAYTVGLADGSWQIATMSADGGDVRLLTSGPGIHEVPSWSPDGSWIAYDYSPTMPDEGAFHTTLWRTNADGSDQQPLGDPKAFDVEPRISPDGQSVLFERVSGETQVIMVRDLASGREREIRSAGTAAEHANWSPDGRSIIYNVWAELTDAVPKDQVEQIAADAEGEPEVLFRATTVRGGFKPWYSPDGARILFGCVGLDGKTDDDACLMDADGSNPAILVDEPGIHENHFSWGVAARGFPL